MNTVSHDVIGPSETLSRLTTLPNGGFEIILRTWSELCGNILQGPRGLG